MTSPTLNDPPRASRKFAAYVIALGLAAGAVATTGTAYAYVRSTGSGNGTSSTPAGIARFTTTATVASGSTLAPGGSAPLTVIVNNSANAYALTVTSLTLDTTRTVGVTGAAGTCSNPSLTVSTPLNWAGISVAPHSSSAATQIPGAVTLGAVASACQGATLTVPVTLSGHS